MKRAFQIERTLKKNQRGKKEHGFIWGGWGLQMVWYCWNIKNKARSGMRYNGGVGKD